MNSQQPDESTIRQAASAVDLDLAPEHLPGVVLYYRMMADFAATVAAFPLDETVEPAAVFVPCAAAPRE